MPSKKNTKMQQYGDTVRRKAKKFQQARQALEEWQAPDNAHFRNVVRDGRVQWGTLGMAAGESVIQGGKLSGVALLWMMEYLTRGLGGLMVDNPVLRAGERAFSNIKVGKNKQGKDKKIQAVLKNHPNLAAYLTYYMSMASLIFGSVYGADAKESIKDAWDAVQVWVDDITTKDIKLDDFALDPRADEEQWQQQINAIQPYVIAHLILTEGFIETVYLDNGDGGTATIGFGFTVQDKTHRDFAKRVLGRSLGNGDCITKEEARLVTDAWLREKVYPQIKQNFITSIDGRTFITLAVTAYNAGEYTFSRNKNTGAPVRDAVNQGKSKEEIAQLLVQQYGKKRGTQWGGMPNKYAVCASYLVGDIPDSVILNSISEAPYALEPYLRADVKEYKQIYDANKKKMVKGRLVIYSGTSGSAKPAEFVRLPYIGDLLQKPKVRKTHGTVQRPVSEFMTAYEVERIRNGVVFNSGNLDYQNVKDQIEQVAQPQLTESERLNEIGEELFLEGKYSRAIDKFKAALDADAKNFIVYSNLSIAYYRNGQYDKGLNVVRSVIDSDYFDEMPTNIQGYTYYNAALCCEKMGDKAPDKKAQGEYYNQAQQYLEVAKQKSGQDYDVFSGRLKRKLIKFESKKVAFNTASANIDDAMALSFVQSQSGYDIV